MLCQRLVHGLSIPEKAVVVLVGQYFENQNDGTSTRRRLDRVNAAEGQRKLKPPGVGQRRVEATTCCKLGWNPIFGYLIPSECIVFEAFDPPA